MHSSRQSVFVSRSCCWLGRTHLFSDCILDIVEIFGGKEGLPREFTQPLLVLCMVVKWEDSLDIAPLARLRGDSRTALFFQTCDHLIDQAVALRICQGLLDESLGGVLNRLNLADAVKPISHARAVDDLSNDVLIASLDEDKKRCLISIPDLSRQTDFSKSLDQVLELCRGGLLICPWSAIPNRSPLTPLTLGLYAVGDDIVDVQVGLDWFLHHGGVFSLRGLEFPLTFTYRVSEGF